MFSRVSLAGRRIVIATLRYHRNSSSCTNSLLSSMKAATSTTAPNFRQLTQHRLYSRTTVIHWKIPDDEEPERIIIPGQPEISQIGFDGYSQEELEKILDEEIELEKQRQAEKFVPNWRPGMRKRPLQMHYKLEEFEYELEPEKHEPRWNHRLDRRCGALAIKVGMMPIFDDWGIRHPCTVLLLDKNIVLGHKTMERDGYRAIRVAAGERKRKNVGKTILGQYKEIIEEDESPPYLVREFRISEESFYIPVTSRIHARHFVPGQNVDVSGITKGKGFQGGMKRWGFKGMPASHGVSLSHRAIGSTGSCQDPGRVWKGKKMPGRMGGVRRTVQNIRVIKIDRGRDLVYVIGQVPGNKGEWVEIKDAVKVPLFKTDKVLDGVFRPPLPTFDYDESIDGCGKPGYEIMMPLPQKDPLAYDIDEKAA